MASAIQEAIKREREQAEQAEWRAEMQAKLDEVLALVKALSEDKAPKTARAKTQ
jgi:hypothetical protein